VSSNCVWCRGNLHKVWDINELEEEWVVPMGSSFMRKNERATTSTKHIISFNKCKQCNLRQISSSSSIQVLGNINDHIHYREPEEHYEQIASELCNLVGNKNELRINYLNKKGEKLCEILQTKFKENTSNRTNECQDLGSANIIIANRLLEHCNSHVILWGIFSGIAKDSLLVIEALDFNRNQDKGNHSFVWDERVSYFSLEYIKLYANLFGYECIYERNYSEHAEPFWIAILKRFNSSEPSDIELNNLRIEEDKCTRIEDSMKIVSSNCGFYLRNSGKVFYFVGIGHKAQFVAAMLKKLDQNVKINLYDSNDQKIETIWDESEIQCISKLVKQCAGMSRIHIVFSFKGQLVDQLMEDIINQNELAEFSHIGEWYSERDAK